MTTGEIASLFYVRGVTVEAAIRKLRKDGIADGGSCRRIRLQEAKGYTEIYGMETVIALSFRFDTGQAALFRKWLARTVACSKKEPTVLFLHPRKSLRSCSCIIRMGHTAERHRHGLK